MRNKLANIRSNDGRFHDGNPATGTLGTIVTAQWLNDVQDILQDIFEEQNNVLALVRAIPNSSNKNQIAQAITAYYRQNLSDSINSTSSIFGASSQAVKQLNDKKIDKSAISHSVDSTSSETVASSRAVKIAFDKATHADNSALKKIGEQSLSGILRFNAQQEGHWSSVQFGTKQGFWQVEMHPDSHQANNRRFNFLYQQGSERFYLGFPSIGAGETVAYQSWVSAQINAIPTPPNASTTRRGLAQYTDNVNFDSSDWGASAKALRTVNLKAEAAQTSANNAQNSANTAQTSANNANNNANNRVAKSGDTMTGVLTVRKQGYGAYVSQLGTKAPFFVEQINDGGNVYFPFLKGIISNTANGSGYKGAFSFGYVTSGVANTWGEGVIHFITDSNRSYGWKFRENGDFISAGDVKTNTGKSLDNTVNKTGDTMTGTLTINTNEPRIHGNKNGQNGWFLGYPNNTSTEVFLHSYALNTELKLKSDRVETNKPIYVNNDRVALEKNYRVKEIAILTGVIDHGGTLPLPAGFTEAQCRWILSINEDNPTNRAWDIEENGAHVNYRFRCWANGRKVEAQTYQGGHGPLGSNWIPARANYMVIGVK